MIPFQIKVSISIFLLLTMLPLTGKRNADTCKNCVALVSCAHVPLGDQWAITCWKKLISKFGRISPKTSMASLKEFHRAATGDRSASLTTAEGKIDERIWEALEMEDPNLTVDLREQNKGQGNKLQCFGKR